VSHYLATLAAAGLASAPGRRIAAASVAAAHRATVRFRPRLPGVTLTRHPRPRPAGQPTATTRPSRPVLRSTIRSTTVNNHYHGDAGHSGGGGLSITDYLVLHSLTNHNNGPSYVNAQPAVVAALPVMTSTPMGSYEAPPVLYQQEESHF
jgi:hypothetical protein